MSEIKANDNRPELIPGTKYEHVVAFAEALPAIRSKVREHT